MAKSSLPEKIAQYYYSHGLFCSSHPIISICIAISVFLICCYPLLNIPLPGRIPQRIYLPHKQVQIENPQNDAVNSVMLNNNNDNTLSNFKQIPENPNKNILKNSSVTVNLSLLMNETVNLPYLWAKEEPLVFVQQIILKTGVWPWHDELKLSDAFRAPLQEAFRLLEMIRNHEHEESGTSLGHVCFHVENVKSNVAAHKVSPILPEYSCLLLSPANLWQQNIDRFLLDTNILSTVFSHQNLQKGKVSVAEMVFGMQLKDTGIKRYPLRARPRVLQYAVTLFLNKLDDKYLNSLREKLYFTYPLHHRGDKNFSTEQIMLIYYPGEFNYREFIPLSLTFVGLFIYIYFSVRKLEFVKSKLGLAVAAVALVAASLTMTIGVCFFFGLTLSFQGKEIFPYLVILVSVENVFVLTKSVMSIDYKLDVKIRLAQGLSKEGWSITKNLLIEITILTISLFTFVPVIQQFSIFMIVSLLSDFFLQMIFFTTVLGIDIRLKEAIREKIGEFQLNQHMGGNPGKFFIHNFTGFPRTDFEQYTHSNQNLYSMGNKIIRSKSHPRLNGINQQHANVVANVCQDGMPVANKNDKRIPKRIRLVKIWARTRFFQRAFMIWMVVWISMIIYNSGIIENIFDITNMNIGIANNSVNVDTNVPVDNMLKTDNSASVSDLNNKNKKSMISEIEFDSNNRTILNESLFDKSVLENDHYTTEILNKTINFASIKYSTFPQPWLRLSQFHWSTVLAQYNVTYRGRYLAVLPPILIKHRVSPEKAAAIRIPGEKDGFSPPSRWQALVAALDPLDHSDFEIEDNLLPYVQLQNTWDFSQSPDEIPYYPSSPMEILFLAILCLISVFVISYTMVVLYGCVCTKNYAEWRTSWKSENESQATRPALQFVMEAVPIVVSGHTQEIECLATNGESVVSSCLQGQLKMWNASNGELIANIDRHTYFRLHGNKNQRLNYQVRSRSQQNSDESDYLYFKPKMENDNENTMQKGDYSDSVFCLFNNSPDNHLRHTWQQNQWKSIPYRGIIAENKRNSWSNNDHKQCNMEVLNSANLSYTHYDRVYNDVRQTPNSIYIEKSNNHSDFQSFEDLSSESSDFVQTMSLPNESLNERIFNGTDGDIQIKNSFSDSTNDSSSVPSIWCMDFADDLIVLGCSNGRLEFWEASTAQFKCIFDDEISASVSNVKLLKGLPGLETHVVVARLTGHLDLLLLESNSATQKPFKKGHVRAGSAGSILLGEKSTHNRFGYEQPNTSKLNSKPPSNAGESSTFNFDLHSNNEEADQSKTVVQCRRLTMTRAHQQSITTLECDLGRILTGSQDHTLKVFSSYDLSALYTLHGHCGPITCAFIDKFWPMVSGSGSDDGLLCVWDLMSGTCLYSIQAHDGSISGLISSESYVISMGVDEKLCIWDRFRGHLLNCMNIGQGPGICGMLTLTHSLIITGGRGGLIIWDASTGEAVRKVVLGPSDGYVFVRQILPLKDAIVCDYANELRIIRFPIISRIDNEYERKND